MNKIAIIGFGPRGLNALENLFSEYAKINSGKYLMHVHIFEKAKSFGAGQVWEPQQTACNWINISVRALKDFPPRETVQLNQHLIPGFPSFYNWLKKEYQEYTQPQPDQFPPRKIMGEYLKARADSLVEILVKHGYLSIINDQVAQIKQSDNALKVYVKRQAVFVVDEVVLAIGHQSTASSDELIKWEEFAATNHQIRLYKSAYPSIKIIESEFINKNTVVGIRGFGLTMLDVLRALTTARGGRFEVQDSKLLSMKFHSSDQVPKNIIPFSLDGLAVIPKPLNKNIDAEFTPSESGLTQFKEAISPFTNGERKTNTIDFLLSEMADVIAPLYQKCHQVHTKFNQDTKLKSTIINWLKDEKHEHPAIYERKAATEKVLKDYIEMALGIKPFTLDYFIGQVWRHCQPAMYKLFSYAALPQKVMTEIVALDERLKRYSYGPPVESMQQLLALVQSGIVTLDFVDNPEILLSEGGWEIQKNKKAIKTSCMINSLLADTDVKKVDSTLIQSLLEDDLLQPVATHLGIETEENGLIKLASKKQLPIASLGRLNQGSTLGVDAILECFNWRINLWAKGVIERMVT